MLFRDREGESETRSSTTSAQDDPWNIQFISDSNREVHNRVVNNGQDRILEMHTKQEITKYGGRVLVKGRYEGHKITIRGRLYVGGVTQAAEEEVGVVRRIWRVGL